MSSNLCISIQFLDSAFHGRGDGNKPEWPPSPLRVFQSLVAAAAALRRTEAWAPHVQLAFEWLERQVAPTVIAPAGITASGYRLSVPNNAMDIPALYWAKHKEPPDDKTPSKQRDMKTVRPTLMIDGDRVRYLWSLPDPLTNKVRNCVETLSDIAKSIIALGWGIDMVVGQGGVISNEEAEAFQGERWLPNEGATDNDLRVPVKGTLAALIHRHECFLNQLGPDCRIPLPLLSAFTTITYRRATDPPIHPIASFSLLKPDASEFLAFDPVRRGLTVIGMVRHTTKTTAARAGWPEQRINEFILGHGESQDGSEHIAVGPKRFVYLPLPSIEARGGGKKRVVGSIRRVILSTFADNPGNEISWARRALSGQELIDEVEKKPVALLSGPLPETEKIVQYYTKPASSWATVSPVVLPGYDDPAHYRRRLKKGTTIEEQKRLLEHLGNRIDNLLRKAIVQAGFSQTLADHVELEWGKVGFLPGVDHADRYGIPDHLTRYPRYHVRLRWHDSHGSLVNIPGPICIGGGRYFGLGLFVRE